MRSLHIALAFGVILLFCTSLLAQEDAMKFIQSLREKGYADLSVEQCQFLLNQKDTSAEIKKLIPLELARSRTELAATFPSGNERESTLALARKDLEAFIATNPAEEQADEAKLALGQTMVEQARAKVSQISRTRGMKDAENQIKNIVKEAATFYKKADETLGKFQTDLEKRLGLDKKPAASTAKNPPIPTFPMIYQRVVLARIQALYDTTRLPTLPLSEVGIAATNATELAKKLATTRTVNPLGWSAYALLGRLNEGSDDPEAERIYKAIEAVSRPDAITAQKQVRYFRLARADASDELLSPKDARNKHRTDAERWLTLYGPTAGTAKDAQHVRGMLCSIYESELMELNAAQQGSTDGQTKLNRCVALLESMDNGRPEVADAIEARKFSLLRRTGRGTGALDTLKNFDEFYLRAQLEAGKAEELMKQIQGTPEAARKELGENYKKQVRTVITVIQKALLIPEGGTDRHRTRLSLILSEAYRILGDGPRAAMVAENIARTTKQPQFASASAGDALKLYQFLAGQGDPIARNKQLDMATFLEQRYPDSTEAAEAYLSIGKSLVVQKQYGPATAMLLKTKGVNSNYAQSRYYAGYSKWAEHLDAATKAQKPTTTPSNLSNEAIAYFKEAIDTYSKIPPAEADVKMAVQTKLLLARAYNTLGQTTEVTNLVDPLLKQMEKKELPKSLAAGTEAELIDLALNAALKKNDEKAIGQVMQVVQARTGDAALGDTTTLLRRVATQVRGQIESFDKAGNKDQAAKANTSFRNMLGQVEKDPKLSPEVRYWLASQFNYLKEYGKAVAQFQAIPVPDGSAKSDDPKATVGIQAAVQKTIAQRHLAEALADRNDRDKQLANLEKPLQDLLTKDWAKRNPLLLREEILLMELRGKYSGKTGSIARWDQYRAKLAPSLDKNEPAKALYAEATYHLAFSIYQEGKLLKDATAKGKSTSRAASLLVDVKDAKPSPELAAQVETLLANKDHADLKTAYDQIIKTIESSKTSPAKK